MVLEFNSNKALIFRVTHIKNMQWILKNGLHCRNSNVYDPDFVQIGNPDLISKRQTRKVPITPGGTLSDYISFYFTPFSMMMYNINTGYGIRPVPNSEIVIMVSSLHKLASCNITAVYTDRHASLVTAQFFSSLDSLNNIDWEHLKHRDFRRDLENPEKTDRYQAEALIYKHLTVDQLMGIVCYGANEERILLDQMREAGTELNIKVLPNWYF